MSLERWILAVGERASWCLIADGEAGLAHAPGGPWLARPGRLSSPLLTRPLRLALHGAPQRAPHLNAIDVHLDVSQVEQAPGPAALRPDAGDDEWHHALDELMGTAAALAEAAGWSVRTLTVAEHRLHVHLARPSDTPPEESIDRLILCAHAWRLAGLSRGLRLSSAVMLGGALRPVDARLYEVRTAP